MMMVLSLTCLFYIITDIQYWMTLYIININKATLLQAQSAFAFVCITSPTAGAIASGYISDWVGGYGHKNAIKLCFYLAAISGIISIPLPWFDSFYAVIINLWIYLFIGGVGVPLLTGVYLEHVEIEYRTEASSLANVFYQAFGFAPAPFIWGAVQSATGGKYSRWGLISTLLMNIPPLFFSSIAYW
jgi:hypothetical protein